MAAQQVKLALPVFFLLCTNLLLGTFTFYYAVKAKLPCNDTDMELENIPTTEVDLFDLGIAEDEFDKEIVLLGTAFGQVVSPTLKLIVTTSHVQELAMTTAALMANLSESADGRE